MFRKSCLDDATVVSVDHMMLACFHVPANANRIHCSETTRKHSISIVCSVQMIGTKTCLIHMQTCQTKLLSRADGMTNGLQCANFSKLKNARRWGFQCYSKKSNRV